MGASLLALAKSIYYYFFCLKQTFAGTKVLMRWMFRYPLLFSDGETITERNACSRRLESS